MKLRRLLIVFVLPLLLAACQIEGGVPRPSPTLPPATMIAPDPQAPIATPEPTVPVATLVRESALRIGLLNDPGDLLPYHLDSADERVTAPISELLFPEPLLALNYTYTTTGVLTRVPSVENGDVVVEMVDVYLDSSNLITTTVTDVLTQVQQLSVTFNWNPELRWADGEPVTADDSLFAYELALQANLGQDAAGKLALIERYEVVDTYTTRAVLRPDFIDPAYITTYWTPLPRHVFEGVDPLQIRTDPLAVAPIGYGPYMVERRDQGTVRLARNPHFAGPAPVADVVTFVFRNDLEQLLSSIEGGSLDLAFAEQPDPAIFAELQRAAANGAIQLETVASPIWEHLDFNLDVPLLQDYRLRRAIAYAVDRQALVEALLLDTGTVLESWIVPEHWAAADPDDLMRYPYDPEQARRLLDEAGFIDSDEDGIREAGDLSLSLTLVTTQGSAVRLAAAERIRADLADVGISIMIVELPTSDLYSQDGPLFRRTFELALFAWIAGPDPRGWERWSCAGVPSPTNNWTGNNFPGWCFFEADKAIRIATTTIERTERREAYVLQQQLFSQEVPVLPLFQRVDIGVMSPSLQGVQIDPTAPITWNIGEWIRE
jgi:peptide/nickel transport system substrate-binding protein